MEDVFEKGDGSWVTMRRGQKLLDFTSGIGTTNLGASGGRTSVPRSTVVPMRGYICCPRNSRVVAHGVAQSESTFENKVP